jgi:3-hydroxyacyl-[acyl-carrier-protein] dehydratase
MLDPGAGSVSSRPMRFRLIDAVLQQDEDRIVAVKNVTLAEEYLADHFPSFPVLPGVFMLEALVQAARRLCPAAPPRYVLGGVKALRYGTFVGPGETLRVEVVRQKIDDAGVITFKGEGLVVPSGTDPAEADTAVSGRFTMRPMRIAKLAAVSGTAAAVPSHIE